MTTRTDGMWNPKIRVPIVIATWSTIAVGIAVVVAGILWVSA